MLTTDDLIEDLKARASIPTSQNLFDTERFIQILNSEQNTKIYPLIKRLKQNFFLTYVDTTLSDSLDYIVIPSEALGASIVDIFVDKNKLPLIPLQEKERYSHGVYLESNKIKFINPSSARNQTIRIYYYKRPSKLIATNKTAPITAINPLNFIDVNNAVSSFVVGSTLDVINHLPHFEVKDTITIIAKVNNKQYEVSSSTNLTVGNYLSPTGFTPIPFLPLEAFELLSARASIKCLEAMKDTEGLQLALSDYQQIEQNTITLLAPRTENIYKKIGSSNSLWNSW